MNYYDIISEGYNELYKEEQLEKIKLIEKYVSGKIGCWLWNWNCWRVF